MALEAINKIQEAETNANTIIEKAVEVSKEIINTALIEGDKEYNTIIEDAMLKAKQMKENALIQGKEDSQPFIIHGEKEVDKVLNTPQSKIDLAVSLVIERIVKFNGNS
ncbi:V-type ATP synthase subunit H [Clostridium sp.]|uniref:V-type ATP synthase subunit H n=1 Tax=Clostridium sp. TaxID=1506 RepID=UPI003216ADFB